MSVLVAACLAGASAALFISCEPRRRMPREPRSRLGAMTLLAGVCLGAAVAAVIGGLAGLGLGIVTAGAIAQLAPRITEVQHRSTEQAAQDRVRAELAMIAGLLSALLSSGATVPAAVRSAADAVRGPARTPLAKVAAAIELGADPDEAWSAGSPALEPVAQALRRSAMTGAPAAALLDVVAQDAAREQRARADAAARKVGVRAVLPLAACFLPAFLLVGVVPVIASVALSVTSG